MADAVTPTRAFVKPEIGASKNTWGTKLNQNFDKLDLLLRANQNDGGNYFLPADRPSVFTYNLTLKSINAGTNYWEQSVADNTGRWYVGTTGAFFAIRPLNASGIPENPLGGVFFRKDENGFVNARIDTNDALGGKFRVHFTAPGVVEATRPTLGNTRFNAGNNAINTGGPDQANMLRHLRCDDTNNAIVAQIAANGNIANANNSYGGISDVTLKENIEDAKPQLDDVLAMRVVNYNMIGSDEKQIGMIAQELREIKPGLVEELPVDINEEVWEELDNPTDHVLSIKYSVLVPILVKAIQELAARVKELENA